MKQIINYNKVVTGKINAHVIDLPLYKCRVKFLDKKNSGILDKKWKCDRDYAMKTSNHLEQSSDVIIATKIYSRAFLVHELYHCVDYIFEYIGGMEKPYESKEARAYLIGYLYEEALKFEKYLK